jgi:hypothetical protein
MTFNFRNIAALTVLCAAIFMTSCEDETKTEKIYEPITIVQPDSVVVNGKRKESVPLEIKFTTDRPILYTQGMYSIDSTNDGFNEAGSDTVFIQYDSIPTNNKKTYTGSFPVDSAYRTNWKIRIKVSMQALGNNNVPDADHYYEKFLRIDVK